MKGNEVMLRKKKLCYDEQIQNVICMLFKTL